MIRFLFLPVLVAVFLLPQDAFAGAYKPSSAGVSLEVVMDEAGNARVAGARVREVRSDGFTAETLWGTGKLTWTVQTDESTAVLRRSGASIPLTQVTPGDYVSFVGTIQENMAPFTVRASSVRDWSISENRVVYVGKISDIDTETRTAVITTEEGDTITVRTNEDTAFAQNGARSILDFSVGDSVLAFGDGNSTTIAATKLNLVRRALAGEGPPPKVATGFGAWIDNILPQFFEGRMY